MTKGPERLGESPTFNEGYERWIVEGWMWFTHANKPRARCVCDCGKVWEGSGAWPIAQAAHHLDSMARYSRGPGHLVDVSWTTAMRMRARKQERRDRRRG